MIVETTYKDWIIEKLEALKTLDKAREERLGYKPEYIFYDHSYRVAENMRKLALKMVKAKEMAEALYWAMLAHDIGKINLPVEIWDLKDKPTEDQKKIKRSHTLEGCIILCDHFKDECDEDPFLKLTLDLMENHHECMDGSGYLGKDESQLSEEVRMACICDSYDGWHIFRPHYGDRDVSPPGVLRRMRTEKTGQFDHVILDIFEKMIIESSLQN